MIERVPLRLVNQACTLDSNGCFKRANRIGMAASMSVKAVLRTQFHGDVQGSDCRSQWDCFVQATRNPMFCRKKCVPAAMWGTLFARRVRPAIVRPCLQRAYGAGGSAARGLADPSQLDALPEYFECEQVSLQALTRTNLQSMCFAQFGLETRFAPQRRALFQKRGIWCHVHVRHFRRAYVAFGDIDAPFVRQAWHLRHWAGPGGALGLLVKLMLLSCGRHGIWRHGQRFVWQAWHLWHWAGSGGTPGRPGRHDALLGSVVAFGDVDGAFVWQAWRFVTLT
eukprot:s2784_g7.t1